MATQRCLELLQQHRDPFAAALAMTNRIVDRHFLGRRAVGEKHLHRIADIPFVRVKIVGGELRVLTDLHPAAQGIDAWVGSHGVTVIIRRQTRSEEHTSELQSLMRISYAVFCLKKKK